MSVAIHPTLPPSADGRPVVPTTTTISPSFRPRTYSSEHVIQIHQFSRKGQYYKALDAFREMSHSYHNHHDLHIPLWLSLTPAIRCCTVLKAINTGREIHAYMARNQFQHTDRCHCESSMVRFYASCGLVGKARKLFDLMLERDVVSWTILIRAYADHEGYGDEAWCLLEQMLSDGIVPNEYTFTTMLRFVELERGRQIHSQISKRRWGSEAFVGSALIGMYGRNCDLSSAQMVFDWIEEKDEVCFNSLISAYGRNRNGKGIISTFVKMTSMGLSPNQSTFVGILNGCANLGSPNLSKQIHARAIVDGYGSTSIVEAVLIDAYVKCGILESARAIFYRTGTKNSIFVWNSIIGGYGKHGFAKDAIELFNLMEMESVLPDHITFTCLLSACSHAGLLSEGWRLFKLMTDSYKIPARSEHCCCMIDLMGRAGMINEAYELIRSLDCDLASASIWGSLLSSCRMWGDIEVAEIAASRLLELEQGCSSSYVALAGTLAANGQHNDAKLVRKLMDAQGIKKDAGCSWIEVDGEVHKFRAGEPVDHPKSRIHVCEGAFLKDRYEAIIDVKAVLFHN